MKYVALLRGINVGGNRTVPMTDLRQVFAGLGFSGISTYINSGNVIFSSSQVPDAAQIEAALKRHFGFTIGTLVLSQVKLASVISAIPSKWANDTAQKSDIAFLFDDADSPDIVKRVGYRSEIETFIYVPGALIMNISRTNQPKGSLLKLVGTPLYRQMTIRNINTVHKLADLARE